MARAGRATRWPRPVPIRCSRPITAAAAGDFDGDGALDLAVIATNNLLLLDGKGDGTFTAGAPLMAGTGATDVVVADFDGDGRVDVAVTSRGNLFQGESVVRIFLND